MPLNLPNLVILGLIGADTARRSKDRICLLTGRMILRSLPARVLMNEASNLIVITQVMSITDYISNLGTHQENEWKANGL